MKIDDALNSRKNNFDTLRFVGAALVIYSHSFPLTGQIEYTPGFYQNTYGGLGVGIFLMISGFLITFSWFRTNNIIKFMKARILRIFPALVIAILISAFILGPLVTNLTLKEYFTNSSLYNYLKTINLYDVQYILPGVFIENPYPNAVNGSLWTLAYEFTFYIILAILGVVKLLTKNTVVFIISLVIALYSFNAFADVMIYSLQMSYILSLGSFFLVGVIYYFYRDTIVLKKEFALISVLILVLSIPFGGINHLLFLLFGGYLIMYIGLSVNIRLPNMSKYGDLSYGMYIYAFPCQQLVSHLIVGVSPFSNFTLAFIMSAFLAFLSWHLIEKPALKFKNFNIVKNR